MPTINTLVQDINGLLEAGKEFDKDSLDALGKAFQELIKDRLTPRKGPPEGFLRMSNLGSPDRQLWYTVNKPEAREKLSGQTLLKFLYGDVIELLVLFLARQAGHTVELEQKEIEVNGVKGHPDAVIDGVLVDVKSASGYGMSKFEKHNLENDDPFHYLYQLSSYLDALRGDDALKVKGMGAFLAVDKSSGKMVLDMYRKKEVHVAETIEEKKAMLAQPEPPARCYQPVPDGASGNQKLGTECSYCSFKNLCHPGLRTFLYSSGPRYLTKVVKEPDVKELV